MQREWADIYTKYELHIYLVGISLFIPAYLAERRGVARHCIIRRQTVAWLNHGLIRLTGRTASPALFLLV